jgi:uncharacterized cupredoxin-like copper-binding protein
VRPRSGERGKTSQEVPMSMRFAFFVSVVLLALAGAGCAAAQPAKAHGTTVKVVAKDYSFTLSRKSVPHGSVTFTIKNEGKTSHDFSIAGHKSKTISPGKSTRLVVTLKKGSDPYKCTIDGHASLGMKGVLKVT